VLWRLYQHKNLKINGMTPKEKANELVDCFRIILMNQDTDCGNEILCTMIAIKHAEICVAETLQHAQMIQTAYEGHENPYQYFLKVRHELSLL
jgi:hypothetical protein